MFLEQKLKLALMYMKTMILLKQQITDERFQFIPLHLLVSKNYF